MHEKIHEGSLSHFATRTIDSQIHFAVQRFLVLQDFFGHAFLTTPPKISKSRIFTVIENNFGDGRVRSRVFF